MKDEEKLKPTGGLFSSDAFKRGKEITRLVKSKKLGLICAFAHCEECGWCLGINIDTLRGLRKKVHAHVNNTGHRVNLETRVSTTYFIGYER